MLGGGTDTNWICSDYLTKPLSVYLKGDIEERVATIAYYDADKKFIDGVVTDYKGIVSLKEGASYFRVCSSVMNFTPVIRQVVTGKVSSYEDIIKVGRVNVARVIQGKYWTAEDGLKNYSSYFATRINLSKITASTIEVVSYAGNNARSNLYQFYVDSSHNLHEVTNSERVAILGKYALKFTVPKGSLAVLLCWDTDIYGKCGYITINGSPYVIECTKRFEIPMTDGYKINSSGEIVEDADYAISEPFSITEHKDFLCEVFADDDVVSLGYYAGDVFKRGIKGDYYGVAPKGYADSNKIRICTKSSGKSGDLAIIKVLYNAPLALESDVAPPIIFRKI